MSLQLRSLIKSSGELEVSLQTVPIPELADDEILLRVEATPINPSDLGQMFGPGIDMSTLTHKDGVVTAKLKPGALEASKSRLDEPMLVGNEGAGTVVKAGASEAAQSLLGKIVAAWGGGFYAQYRVLKASDVLPFPEGVTAKEAAAAFVNPLTALGMVETMRLEGHKALIHTAASSNLGQMLVKLCLQENIELVNIVRSEQHVALLRSVGAKHIVNSSSPNFMDELVAAIDETGATLAFDAVGGGPLAAQILHAMEVSASKKQPGYHRYGTTTPKQVYIYGMLDPSPTIVDRTFGFTWGLGGWLLIPFLTKIGIESLVRLRERVAKDIKTTFASQFSAEISLTGALKLENIYSYIKQATGQKYLIVPTKDAAPGNPQ